MEDYLKLFTRLDFPENKLPYVEFPLDFLQPNPPIEYLTTISPTNGITISKDWVAVPILPSRISELNNDCLKLLRIASGSATATRFKIREKDKDCLVLCVAEWHQEKDFCYVGLAILDNKCVRAIGD